MTAALQPAQILNGRVTYADTGKPVPHAPLGVRPAGAGWATPAEFETDAEGRLRANPPPADHIYRRHGLSPGGQPYLTASKRLVWPKGELEQSLDLALPRGVSIRGKVTEEGSGKPVPGATVDFVSRGGAAGQSGKAGSTGMTASDGSFQLGAAAGSGYLFVKGPSDDYVLQADRLSG